MNSKYEQLKTKTILYIEDDQELRSNISKILKKFFKKVHVAEDGEDAYDILQENSTSIQLIVTDINMPNMNGISFVKYLRSINKNLPVIVISAYTDTDYLLDSIDLNILKYITKPFTSSKVYDFLDKVCEHFEFNNILKIDDKIYLEIDRSIIVIQEKEVSLTKKELTFFKMLIEKSIVTYEDIEEYLWGETVPTENAIRIFIRKLKQKIELNLIKNRNQIGYFLNKDY